VRSLKAALLLTLFIHPSTLPAPSPLCEWGFRVLGGLVGTRRPRENGNGTKYELSAPRTLFSLALALVGVDLYNNVNHTDPLWFDPEETAKDGTKFRRNARERQMLETLRQKGLGDGPDSALAETARRWSRDGHFPDALRFPENRVVATLTDAPLRPALRAPAQPVYRYGATYRVEGVDGIDRVTLLYDPNRGLGFHFEAPETFENAQGKRPRVTLYWRDDKFRLHVSTGWQDPIVRASRSVSDWLGRRSLGDREERWITDELGVSRHR
jgi:hypothetical protein